MTERSTDEQPKTYSELRAHASRLEAEVARLRKQRTAYRKEVRRLNAKQRGLLMAVKMLDTHEFLQKSRAELVFEKSAALGRAAAAEGKLLQAARLVAQLESDRVTREAAE